MSVPNITYNQYVLLERIKKHDYICEDIYCNTCPLKPLLKYVTEEYSHNCIFKQKISQNDKMMINKIIKNYLIDFILKQ